MRRALHTRHELGSAKLYLGHKLGSAKLYLRHKLSSAKLYLGHKLGSAKLYLGHKLGSAKRHGAICQATPQGSQASQGHMAWQIPADYKAMLQAPLPLCRPRSVQPGHKAACRGDVMRWEEAPSPTVIATLGASELWFTYRRLA